jgi:hypothetical protein
MSKRLPLVIALALPLGGCLDSLTDSISDMASVGTEQVLDQVDAGLKSAKTDRKVHDWADAKVRQVKGLPATHATWTVSGTATSGKDTQNIFNWIYLDPLAGRPLVGQAVSLRYTFDSAGASQPGLRVNNTPADATLSMNGTDLDIGAGVTQGNFYTADSLTCVTGACVPIGKWEAFTGSTAAQMYTGGPEHLGSTGTYAVTGGGGYVRLPGLLDMMFMPDTLVVGY